MYTQFQLFFSNPWTYIIFGCIFIWAICKSLGGYKRKPGNYIEQFREMSAKEEIKRLKKELRKEEKLKTTLRKNQ